MHVQSLAEWGPQLSELARRFGIRVILQFGSTVTGTTHAHSDIDLAIEFATPVVPMKAVLDMQGALHAQFPGHDIDVAILNRADPLFMKKILESCRMLFGTSQDFARLRLYSFKTYEDFQPYLEIERQSVAKRLAMLVKESSHP